MKSIGLAYCVLGSAFLASGCASVGTLNSSFRTADFSDGKSILIDAKQRAVLSNTPTRIGDNRVLCAEPGPDVVSVGSRAFSAGGQFRDQASGGFAASTGEAGGMISAPTTAILSQRHSYYRICEAYMNGAADEIDVMVGIRSNQRTLLGLLAIEQLTGAVRAPPTVLSTAGSANTGQVLAQLSASLATETARRAELEQELQRLRTRRDSVATEQARVEAEQTKADLTEEAAAMLKARAASLTQRLEATDSDIAQTNATLTTTSGLIEALNKSIEKAKEGGAQTSAFGVSINTAETEMDGETAKHIADAVTEIVKHSTSEDYGPTICLSVMRRYRITDGVAQACAPVMNAYQSALNAEAQLTGTRVQAAQRILEASKGRDLTRDELNALVAITEGPSNNMTVRQELRVHAPE